jgi:hypothetical protein
VKIIQPGWGSSGYYPAEVLERDGPKIFTKGTKMYWNHQTPQQEAERPEGDLNNLAAELVTDARYQANGAAGAGLYADAKVFEAYKSHVDDLAPHIGVSIRAMGKVQHGVAEGREGAIISELTNKKSVDFVTAPGAGGQILSLFEAARTVRADKKTTTTESVEQNNFEEARNMEKKEFEALQESVATLQTTVSTVTDENARLKEALALMGAKDVVNAALANLPLPDVTKARLLESLPRTAPMKDGVLDVETFKTKITEAVKVEVDYLTKAAGLGTIRGLGESSSGDDAEFDEAKQQGELEAALAKVRDLKARYLNVRVDDKGNQFNTDLLEAFELGCLLDLAEATVASALNRTESRGAHFRSDYDKRDDVHWLKHTLVVQRGAPGATVTAAPLEMSYKPVVITKFEPKERKY